MASSLTASQLAEIDAALRSDDLFLAIRTYRGFTGSNVADASAFVQTRSQALSEEPVPDLVRAYLASVHARQGELVAWWRDRTGLPCALVLCQRGPQPAFEVSLIEGPMFGHQAHGYTCTLDEVLAAAGSASGFRSVEWDAKGARVAEKIRAFATALLPATPTTISRNATTLHLLDASLFEAEFLFLPETVDAMWWERVHAVAESRGDVADELEEIEGEPRSLPPRASKLILALCVAGCSRQAISTQSTDTFFSDLESCPPNWKALAPDALVAWHQFLSVVGVSGAPRVDLPWWVAGLSRYSGTNAGLLPPPQVRLVARHAAQLRNLFGGGPDAEVLLDLIAAAATESAWVLGVEPQG